MQAALELDAPREGGAPARCICPTSSPIELCPAHGTAGYIRDTISFVVHGTPQPAGSKRAFFLGGRAIVADANKKSRPWKDQVAQVAGEVMSGRPLLQGPLEVTLRFFVHRPKGHHGVSGAVRPSAPRFPDVRPDALKLARGVEDALSGVIYRDDSQIVAEHLFKEYGPERVEIEIRVM